MAQENINYRKARMPSQYDIEVVFNADQIRYQGGDSIVFRDGTTIIVGDNSFRVTDETKGEALYYIIGELLEPDKSIQDKERGYTHKVISSDDDSLVNKIFNGTFNYLSKMTGQVNDQASALERVLMFDRAERSYIENDILTPLRAARNNPEKRANINHKEIGQALLMITGYYDKTKQRIFYKDIKDQLRIWFGFSSEESREIIDDYDRISNALLTLDHIKNYKGSIDSKKLIPYGFTFIGIAMLYRTCGSDQPTKENIISVSKEMAGLGAEKDDIKEFMAYAQKVYETLKNKPSGFGRHIPRIRKIKNRSGDNPTQQDIIRSFVKEFKGDNRILMEHMNPVENYMLVVSQDTDPSRLKNVLERLRRTNYDHLDFDSKLEEINKYLGGKALCIARVRSPENEKIFRMYEGFLDDDYLDSEERAFLALHATKSPDMNLARLTRMKIHAATTNPQIAPYHQEFTKRAVKAAEDRAYSLKELYRIELELRSLVASGIFSKQIADYERIRLDEAMETYENIEGEVEKVQRFIRSLAELTVYGIRDMPEHGKGLSDSMIAANIRDYMNLHFPRGLGMSLKGKFLMDENRIMDEMINNGEISDLSRLITNARLLNGLPALHDPGYNSSTEEDSIYIDDMKIRNEEHKSLTDLYVDGVENVVGLFNSRFFNRLPSKNDLTKALKGKEIMDRYDPSLFRDALMKIIEEPPEEGNFREEQIMWGRRFDILAGTILDAHRPEELDRFCLERYGCSFQEANRRVSDDQSEEVWNEEKGEFETVRKDSQHRIYDPADMAQEILIRSRERIKDSLGYEENDETDKEEIEIKMGTDSF